MTTYAYARTSTVEQAAGLAAQERDLLAAGAEKLFSEHGSATGTRLKFKACMAELQEGDVLMVTKPDRLARSTWHLLEIVEDLNRRGVGLILLSMGGQRLDTRNPTSKLMLTMLAAFAEFERTLMQERQKEGIIKAKADGKYKGKPRVIDRSRILDLSAQIGPEKTAVEMGISRISVYRALRESREAEAA